MIEEIPVKVKIRENSSNFIQEYDSFLFKDPDTGKALIWIWEEGNYSCDCNRRLFFYQNIGIELADSALECGEGKYSVEISNINGQVIYSDFWKEVKMIPENINIDNPVTVASHSYFQYELVGLEELIEELKRLNGLFEFFKNYILKEYNV